MGNLCGKQPTTTKPSSTHHEKKLLLIGAGDSGKSTIFKQLKRIHEKGFSREELLGCKPYIIENIIRNMAQLCHATKTVPLNVRSENVERRDRFAALARNERVMLQIVESWGESMACDFELLWHDDGIRKAFEDYKSNFLVEDNVPYYFDRIGELADPKWIPSVEDTLRTRIKTTGLMIDVGGQRTERRKWVNHFENVDAFLCVCSLSEFDQPCYEDEVTNRMKESVELFGSYINSKYFEGSLVYLVLNKHDIFVEKMKRGANLKQTFGEYTGENDMESAKAFVEGLYRDKDTHNRLRNVIYLNALDVKGLTEQFNEILQDINSADMEI